MAFKLAISPTFRVKVIVEMIGKDGRKEKSDFMVDFKRCTVDQLEEIRSKTSREALQEVVTGWSGLLDEDGLEVPFNQDTLAMVLTIAAAVHGMTDAFLNNAVSGKQKN